MRPTETPRRPNLFVLGAMKCGTSSFHTYLAAHPGIFMSTPKEPCHFVSPQTLREIWPEMWAERYWETDRYLALFKNAGDARYLGESSTDYAKWPLVADVPQRIHSFAPDARFFYLVRDPVERAISHYWHNVRLGYESRSIDEAIINGSEYVEVGNYAAQLARFADIFGQERIMVFRSDTLSRDAPLVMRQAYEWLGLPPDIVAPADLAQKVHVTADTIRTDLRATPALYRALQSDRLAFLKQCLPISWKNELHIRLGGAVRRKDLDDSNVRTLLAELVAPQIEALEQMLGEDFSDWCASP